MNSLLDQFSQHPLAVGLFVLAQITTVTLAAVIWRRRLRVAAAQPQPQPPNARSTRGNHGRAGAKRKPTGDKSEDDESKPVDGKRHPVAVVVAALAAAACTAYSGDTSWRFAEEHLGMHSLRERGFLFFAGELALFGCALMARSNMHYKNKPGAPGMLVWLITTVQVIPAYTESPDIWGGTVRAFVGPVLAALLCHLALGLDLWHAKPGAQSNSVPAVIVRELRERMLSRLGLADRGRNAAQIARDRATRKAVRLAALPEPPRWLPNVRNRRLGAAVARAEVGQDPEQRKKLLRLLAVRRHAGELATREIPSPWDDALREVFPGHAAVSPALSATLGTLAHQDLRRMQPLDAIRTIVDAYPYASVVEIAARCGSAGVRVSEALIGVALDRANTALKTAVADAGKETVPDMQPAPGPQPAVAAPPRTEAVHARIPAQPHPAAAQPGADSRADAQPHAADDEADAQPHAKAPAPDADASGVRSGPDRDELLGEARRLDLVVRADGGRNASRGVSLRQLQRQLHIGQRRAQRLQRLLKQDPQQW
ncbi:hypothetical protein OG937_10760 [Streptomyces sp. NBC_00510]